MRSTTRSEGCGSVALLEIYAVSSEEFCVNCELALFGAFGVHASTSAARTSTNGTSRTPIHSQSQRSSYCLENFETLRFFLRMFSKKYCNELQFGRSKIEVSSKVYLA
jgi:hypothetical protein